MAYDTDDLYERALETIEKNNLFFHTDVYAYLGISHDSYYRFFPVESDRYEAIKDRLDKNKMRTKVSIRSKLHGSTNTAGLLALYKLICTEDERKALAMEYRETESKHTHRFEIGEQEYKEISDAIDNKWD